MLQLLVWLCLFYHPFHVSVHEVVYETKYESIRISSRIFLDDLELALRKENGNDQLSITEDSLLTQTVNKLYFQKHLSIAINGKEVPINYLGGEIEQDVMWVYLEIPTSKHPESILIRNTLLTDIYSDQQNIVHFKINGKKQSYILTAKEKSASYSR